MTRAERKKMLKAEARAWRQLAEWFAAKSRTAWLRMPVLASHAMWASMSRRLSAHRNAQVKTTPLSEQGGVTANDNVLAALFLALECDDEAAAL